MMLSFVLDVLTFARAQGFHEHQMILLIIIYQSLCMYVQFQFLDVGLVYPFILSYIHEGSPNRLKEVHHKAIYVINSNITQNVMLQN